MSSAPPSVLNWSPVDAATSIAGQAVWLFRTVANIAKVPAFVAPAGYQMLFPPVAGAGTRAYAAIRQLTKNSGQQSVASGQTAPGISQWAGFDAPTAIAGASVWGYRSSPNLKAAPPFAVPAGWELLIPPVNGGVPGGQRWYAAIRQSTSAPATTSLPTSPTSPLPTSTASPLPTSPVPTSPLPTSLLPTSPLPTPPLPNSAASPLPAISSSAGAAYTVAASEVLFLTSQVLADGVVQPRLWTFRSATKEGYNCGFWVEPTTPAGQYALIESDLSGANAVTHAVAIEADPYTALPVPAGADLAALMTGAADLTRYELAPEANYTIAAQPYASRRLQLLGQAGTTITIRPAIPATGDWNGLYGVWLTAASARVGLINLSFTAETSRLNSQGKTGTGAAYVPMGSLWAVNCTFGGMDYGIQADSTPNHQADGILVQECASAGMYAQTVWIGGQNLDIDSVTVAASANLLEHPIRSSIVDLATNQLPAFVRVASCTFDATHLGATADDPRKESGAFRDGKYFYLKGNTFVGWAECGQGAPNSWDYFGQYVFDGNTFADPATAPGTGTLNVRAGVNGPGVVCNSTAAMPIVVTAAVTPALAGNKP